MLTTPPATGHTRRISEPGLSLRASNADREQVATRLRRALLDGRLTADEFEERIGHAYSATTLEELRELTRDLPGASDATALDLPRKRLLPGNRPFAVRFRAQFPFWNVVAAVLIPFIGLIVLLASGRESSEVVVSATDDGEGRCVVDVFGVASRRVRRAMIELEH